MRAWQVEASCSTEHPGCRDRSRRLANRQWLVAAVCVSWLGVSSWIAPASRRLAIGTSATGYPFPVSRSSWGSKGSERVTPLLHSHAPELSKRGRRPGPVERRKTVSQIKTIAIRSSRVKGPPQPMHLACRASAGRFICFSAIVQQTYVPVRRSARHLGQALGFNRNRLMDFGNRTATALLDSGSLESDRRAL